MNTTFTKAEIAAAKLLRRYGLTDPRKLVLEDLAMARGVLVIDGELNGAEARLVRRGEKGLIRVSDAIAENGRRRFAIAHELGHWSVHQHTSQLNLCLESDVLGYKGSREELEANAFAGHLLLPGSFLRRTYSAAPSLELARTVAHDLVTSLTATAVRLIEVTNDPCLVVFSDLEVGCVHWWRRSSQCPKVWLKSRQPLSERSAASEILRGIRTETSAEEVDPGAWFSHVDRHESCVVYEESMQLGGYPVILTLLSVHHE